MPTSRSAAGALTADLMINKPLGLSPPQSSLNGPHLYDINPVGVGTMGISILVSHALSWGLSDQSGQALSAFVGLAVGGPPAPLIRMGHQGKYYIARQSDDLPEGASRARYCENIFERNDMAFCSAMAPPSARCAARGSALPRPVQDQSRIADQLASVLDKLLPGRLAAFRDPAGQSAPSSWFHRCRRRLFALIYFQYGGGMAAPLRLVMGQHALDRFSDLPGPVRNAAWLLVLAMRAGELRNGSERQTVTLMQEIVAHERTDAALQKAKEVAEAANFAKSRYMWASARIPHPLIRYSGTRSCSNASRIWRARILCLRHKAQRRTPPFVDGLLDISRVETGTLHLNQTKVCLPDLLTRGRHVPHPGFGARH